MMENDNVLVFWTDGAYSALKNKGGWAFYCPAYKLRVCSGESNTTNNRMEMMAALKALEWVSDSNVPEKNILIYSDSMYVIETMKGKYSKKKNLDLWSKLEHVVDLLFDKKIIWKHTKGHTGGTSIEALGNNVVDQLAVMCTQM